VKKPRSHEVTERRHFRNLRVSAPPWLRDRKLFFAAFAIFAVFVVQDPVSRPINAQGASSQIDVVDLSVADAQQRMAAGTLTSRALTRAYLDRIAAIDDAGPQLNAVIDINPTAIRDAEARDAERKAGKVRGPLHGIPILVKDNIDVAGMINSAGSLALMDNRPKADAFIIRRVREAGVVILGRTNLSEWANFRSTRSTSGWSSRGGQTKNPHVLDRNPCGSSAGSAVAAAASLVSVAIGTETDGSIICPAAVNGVVGLKPTVGLVSRRGIIPLSSTQDTAGPIGRTVADVAALLSGMAGIDDRDPAGRAAAGKPARDYAAFLNRDALKGQRIGVVRRAQTTADADAALTAAIVAMQTAGAAIVDVQIPNDGKWRDAELDVMLYEFKDGLNKYLAASSSAQKSLAALIAFNLANAPRVMPLFGQELFERAQAKGPLTDADYLKARATAGQLAGRDGLLALVARENLAAVVTSNGGGYGVAAVAGTPSITIPIGTSRGLPLGLTLMGPPFSEGRLIGLAYALEQLTNARRPPQFLPTFGQ
jgi:amidase